MLHDRHRRLITVALEAGAPYGAALGGRNALAVHGLSRATSKVIDLVTSREAGPEAARAVEKALRRAGLQAERYNDTVGLENTWPGGRDGAAQWHVRTPQPHDHPAIGGITNYKCAKCLDRDYLALSRAPRSRDPVHTDLGPVLHPEDAAGQKIGDLARRGLVRDYAAAADLLDRYSPDQLIGFARRQDPALDGRDFARLARRLDQTPEIALTGLGAVRPEDIPRLREQFANWPRDAREADRRERGEERERSSLSRQHPERPAPAHARPEARWVPELQPSGRPGGSQPRPARPALGTRQALPPRNRQREAERSEPEITR